MTKKEFSQIALAMQTYYPKDNLFQTDEAILLWYNILKDIEYKVMSMALDKWVSTNKWTPTIADLREYCLKVTIGDTPDWGEAYEKAVKAIHNYGYMHETDALESLDELTRKVVKRLGYKSMCESPITNKMQDRANFRMIYEELANKEREEMQTSENLRNQIAETRQAKLTENIVNQLEAKDV